MGSLPPCPLSPKKGFPRPPSLDSPLWACQTPIAIMSTDTNWHRFYFLCVNFFAGSIWGKKGRSLAQKNRCSQKQASMNAIENENRNSDRLICSPSLNGRSERERKICLPCAYSSPRSQSNNSFVEKSSINTRKNAVGCTRTGDLAYRPPRK